MNRTLKTTVYAVAAVMMLSAGAMRANADYTGYGNGDPGNWDFSTEQKGGPCSTADAAAARHGVTPKCCQQYNPESACPYYSSAGSERVHHAGRRSIVR